MKESKKLVLGHFSPEEDQLLLELKKKHPNYSWAEIAKFMPTRSARQCRDRWAYKLNPNMIDQPWTLEDDILLQNKVSELGHQWSKISKMFFGHNESQVKNRWYSNQRRKERLEKSRKLKAKFSIPCANDSCHITVQPFGSNLKQNDNTICQHQMNILGEKQYYMGQQDNNNLPQPYNNIVQQPYNNIVQQPYYNTVQQSYNNTVQQPYNNIVQQSYNNTVQQSYNNTGQQQYNNVEQPYNNVEQSSINDLYLDQDPYDIFKEFYDEMWKDNMNELFWQNDD